MNSLPERYLLYVCKNGAMEITNNSINGINLYVLAENKQNLNDVKILSQGKRQYVSFNLKKIAYILGEYV